MIVGLLFLTLLCRRKLHRAKDGSLDRLKIANAVTLPAMLYTLIVVVVGELLLRIPASDTIKFGFGDGRVTWLLVVLCIDIGIRIASIFETPNGQ